MNTVKLRNGEKLYYDNRRITKIGKLTMFEDKHNNLYCENPEISQLSDEDIKEVIYELLKRVNNDTTSSIEYEMIVDDYYTCLNDTLTDLDELLGYLNNTKRINRKKIKKIIVGVIENILNYI